MAFFQFGCCSLVLMCRVSWTRPCTTSHFPSSLSSEALIRLFPSLGLFRHKKPYCLKPFLTLQSLPPLQHPGFPSLQVCSGCWSPEMWYPGQQGVSPLPVIMKSLGPIFLVLIPLKIHSTRRVPRRILKRQMSHEKESKFPLGSRHVLSFQVSDLRFWSSESPRRVESPAVRLHG